MPTGPGNPRTLKEWLRPEVYAVFSDHLMIVLAVVLIPATVLATAPESISEPIRVLVGFVNNFVVLAFVLEYVLKLLVAESRWQFFSNPWHVLDLLIVLLSVADVAAVLAGWQAVTQLGGRHAPMLRLIRLVRVFIVAGRTVRRTGAARAEAAAPLPPRSMEIRILEEGADIRAASQAEVCRYISAPSQTWVDLQNFSEGDLDFLSDTLKIPKYVLASKAIQESFPRIDYFPNFTTLFLWDSRLLPGDSAGGHLGPNSFLVICANANIITVCTGASVLVERVVEERLAMPEEPFVVRVLYAILKRKLRDYEEIVRVLERRTAELEDAPVGKTPPRFLEETFELKKQIQQSVNNLWHFRQVLNSIQSGRVTLVNMRNASLSLFAILHGEAEYMLETLEHVKDSVISLIELHINTISFDMNRVMRVLAVITALSTIPAIIGGMLGQNLLGQPFRVTLSEIFVVVLSLMLLALYAFWRKGWLR